MTYHYQLSSTIDDVDRDAWDSVQQFDPSPFSDLRFLRIVERTMGDVSSCWPLLITDQKGRPTAIACLSLFHVDGSILAGPIIRSVAAGMRKVRSQFLRLPVLILGLPVSTGQSSVVLHPEADIEAVRDALLRAIVELERRERPSLTLAKEFDDRQAAELRDLDQSGFLEVPNLPAHEFPVTFSDFDDYVRQRNRKHRHSIRKSQKKLHTGGLEIQHLCGGEALDSLTDDVHRLYVAVYEKSATKFEFLPLEFFRETARQFPEDSWFTFLSHEGHVVAFSYFIAYRESVHGMMLGINYDLNRQFDLYFNIIYELLNRALQLQPHTIHFGQNSPEFKQRLGCHPSRRTLFIRGHRLWHPLINTFSQYIFPTDNSEPTPPDQPPFAATKGSSAPISPPPQPNSRPTAEHVKR